MSTPVALDVGEFVTVKEVAASVRLSKMTVYRMVREGELPSTRVGRSIRIPKDSAVAWIKGELDAGGAQ